MQWEQYLDKILEEETYLDKISIGVDGVKGEIPKIVKASIYMLEKMIKNQGKKNIFVFPDGEQLPYLFMISKLIYNISVGKITNKYSPEDFVPGQILKLGNCVCEFIKVDNHPTNPQKKAIFLKFADVNSYCCPLDIAPFLQVSDTKKRLSKQNVYLREREKYQTRLIESENCLHNFKKIKTHIGESIFYIASVASCERNVNKITIDGETIHDFFLVAKTDYTGNIINYKGKYVGTPALVFSSQLSYVNEAIDNGTEIQSVIINLLESNIDVQLDALDELLERKIPIVAVTNTVNSFELSELKNRGFNVWRWDEDSISSNMQSQLDVKFAKTITRCVDSEVITHSVTAPEISDAFSILYGYKNFIENESVHMNMLFNQLFSISYNTVRNICNITICEKERYLEILEKCRSALEREKFFLQTACYNDFSKVIGYYETIFFTYDMYPKTKKLHELLIDPSKERMKSFYIICSNSDNPEFVRNFWREKLLRSGYSPNIKVLYAKDFINLEQVNADVAFVAGWLSASIIRKIIYSYKIKTIHIFTYECEEGWRRTHTKNWRKGLNNENNRTIVRESFNKQVEDIKTHSSEKGQMSKADIEVLTEQDDLDLILQENKYRQYTSREGYSNDVIEAKPVGFTGGDFILYTNTHTILVATNIISQVTNKIEKKDVSKLKVGDFVVVRESSKDIVRDVADMILQASGKLEYRQITDLWQEPLKLEEALTSTEDVIQRLKADGCQRSEITMKNWIFSDEIIIPQNKEDLLHIANVTGDGILLEKLDDIFEKGRVVTAAHIKAGSVISERLTESIAATLAKEKIDSFNIWDPIELELDDVGTVKVLKVIDIGQNTMPVHKTDCNRIISEEKGELLWQE